MSQAGPCLLVAFAILAGLAGGVTARGEDWPGWLGPDASQQWRSVKLPGRLTPDKVERLWSAPVGGGYAGIAVAGSQVYTLDRPAGKPVERILSFDRASGKLMWAFDYPAEYGDLAYGSGPRTTPLIGGENVFTFGAIGHLTCLDRRSGRLKWKVDVRAEHNAAMPIWGYGSSPVLVGDLVVVQAGIRPGGTIAAFDRKTGQLRWKVLDDRPGYSTPVLRTVEGVRQLIVWTADAAWGLAPDTGAVIWKFPFRTSNYDVAIISPVLEAGRLFVSGYWDGAATAKVEKSGAKPSWTAKVPANLMSTPLWRAGHLYTLDRRQGVLCVRWDDGEVLWSDEHRITARDRNPHAYFVWAGEKAVFLNAEGELGLAEFSPEGMRDLGRARVIGPTWAPPGFAGQDVFARDDREIVAVRILQ